MQTAWLIPDTTLIVTPSRRRSHIIPNGSHVYPLTSLSQSQKQFDTQHSPHSLRFPCRGHLDTKTRPWSKRQTHMPLEQKPGSHNYCVWARAPVWEIRTLTPGLLHLFQPWTTFLWKHHYKTQLLATSLGFCGVTWVKGNWPAHTLVERDPPFEQGRLQERPIPGRTKCPLPLCSVGSSWGHIFDYISRRPPRPCAISYTYSVASWCKDPVCSGQVSGPPHWDPHSAFGLEYPEKVPMWCREYRYAGWGSGLTRRPRLWTTFLLSRSALG